jgi:hypothetical protein
MPTITRMVLPAAAMQVKIWVASLHDRYPIGGSGFIR